MGQIVVNGNVVGETNDQIEIIPTYTSGIKILEIQINDNPPIEIFIPNNGGN